MKEIAVLITCFNRRSTTMECLKSLYYAINRVTNELKVAVFLTDDGSTDGTSDAVQESFPWTRILEGTGDLYWAGGMRNSWKAALEAGYKNFFLLNDDTIVEDGVFEEILHTHAFCLENYGKGGIYVGSTKDQLTGSLSYGGARLVNKFFFKFEKVPPNGNIQQVDLGNGNIMVVSEAVYESIGILSENYLHGSADYDYTLKAKKAGFPVLITGRFCGYCENNHQKPYDDFSKLSFRDRVERLRSPTGLAFHDQVELMRRNFPYRVPFVFFFSWFKVLFPRVYSFLNRVR